MKPLHTRLLEKHKELTVPWEILERDYLLSWILAGMTQIELFREILVFKGGTCLKKCYFGNYRFSEDLDFTCVGNMPDSKSLERLMNQACDQAMKLIDPYDYVEIICERYRKASPHPRGQEAFNIRAKFSWHRKPLTNIMVEITADEKLVRPATLRTILHDYGEPLNHKILTYSLEEIVAEKLRAILQNIQALEHKGWVRSRARDYYDLWRILKEYKDQLDTYNFKELLHEKCKVREVNFSDHNSFFSPQLLAIVEKTWEQWLGPLLPQLPPFDLVIGELRIQVAALL